MSRRLAIVMSSEKQLACLFVPGARHLADAGTAADQRLQDRTPPIAGNACMPKCPDDADHAVKAGSQVVQSQAQWKYAGSAQAVHTCQLLGPASVQRLRDRASSSADSACAPRLRGACGEAGGSGSCTHASHRKPDFACRHRSMYGLAQMQVCSGCAAPAERLAEVASAHMHHIANLTLLAGAKLKCWSGPDASAPRLCSACSEAGGKGSCTQASIHEPDSACRNPRMHDSMQMCMHPSTMMMLMFK